MSMSNLTEMKNGIIFCKKMISQNFWCNYLALILWVCFKYCFDNSTIDEKDGRPTLVLTLFFSVGDTIFFIKYTKDNYPFERIYIYIYIIISMSHSRANKYDSL